MSTPRRYEFGVFPVDYTDHDPLDFSATISAILIYDKIHHSGDGFFDGPLTLILFDFKDVCRVYKLLNSPQNELLLPHGVQLLFRSN